MNTVAILLSAFVLPFVALLIVIWSQRKDLFDRSSRGAGVIVAPSEIGRVEEPAAAPAARSSVQVVVDTAGAGHAIRADADERAERARAWRSSARCCGTPHGSPGWTSVVVPCR